MNSSSPVPDSAQRTIGLENAYHIQTYLRWPVVFVRGHGNRLWDTDGNEYLDFVAGLGVANVGHCHPKVVETVQSQAAQLMHVSNLYYTEPQAELAEKLASVSFADRVFFVNSGAEANETAIKLVRRYASLKWGAGDHTIITALRSFHGRTMKTLAATGQPDKQEPFKPMPPGFKHVPLNDIAALKEAGTPDVCGVMLEPIQGEGGVHPCDPEYLRAVRALCDERDWLLILDEIQTGMGRTGRMWAYEHYDVVPDIMTLAKGLASGLPIGVALASEKVAASFRRGDHGSTFGGGPVPCVAALATLEAIEDERLVERASETGEFFMQELHRVTQKHTMIDSQRGLGMMLALELNKPVARKAAQAMFERRILVNNIGDHILRFLPPLTTSVEDVSYVIEELEQVLQAVDTQGMGRP